MAESSLAIDTDVIETLSDDTQNAVVDLNTNFDEIVTKFNAAFETSTGHDHNGTDSASVTVSYSGITLEEYVQLQLLGGDV